MHRRKYDALDATGSRYSSGRYHQAPDQFALEECWVALYLSLAAEVTIGEVLRNTPTNRMSSLNSYRLSEATADLSVVIDCRSISENGVPFAALVKEGDFATTQRIAHAAVDSGAEATLVPSATRLGDNLVVFPDNLLPESRLEVIGSRDPVLYVERL